MNALHVTSFRTALRGVASLASVGALLTGFVACDDDSVGQDTQDATSCEGAKKDKGGRCRLPNGRFAKAKCCAAPTTACHAQLASAIDACVVDQRENGDWNPETTTLWDLTAACADIEPMAGVRDAICEDEDASFCSLDIEAFSTDVLPVCRREAEARALDATCVFGTTWGEALRSEAIVVVGERELVSGDELGPLQGEQIIEAVLQSSHEPTTVAEAFAAVDQETINYLELWDASARRGFSAYEYGAGDNSYGAIFVQGTTTLAASIGDGDLSGCQSYWGPERRRCQADADCTSGTRCTGSSEASPLGRCIDSSKDDHPSLQADCSREDLDFGCPAGSGLRCSGGSVADGDAAVGMCWPAWMTSAFHSSPELAIADDDDGGVEAQVLAYGLATVDTEVRIDLLISHPRPADLRVTLVNPASNEVLVFDGATTPAPNGEIYLDGVRLGGFSGDESVNGVWRLRVVDSASGEEGTLHRFGITVSSRWD
jgi:subtilisin-like proprotein convertase family protein